MAKIRTLSSGTRVRLVAPHWLLTLRADTGQVVRPDQWDGYYIVRLDQPALYRHADGRQEELIEVREAADNMQVLGPDATQHFDEQSAVDLERARSAGQRIAKRTRDARATPARGADGGKARKRR